MAPFVPRTYLFLLATRDYQQRAPRMHISCTVYRRTKILDLYSVWNTPNSDAGAPVNVFINIWFSFKGVTGQSATPHAIVGNKGFVYVNDRLLGNIIAGGWSYSSFSRWTFTMESVNVMRIYAWNQGSSASLLAAVVNTTNSNQVFAHTNASLVYWDPSITTSTSTTTTPAPSSSIPSYAPSASGGFYYGCVPWILLGNTFLDKSAFWIWDRANAYTVDAPSYSYISFYKAFAGEPGQNATRHAQVDNHVSVYLNQKLLGDIIPSGWGTSSYSRWTFLLEPVKVFKVTAWN